MNNIKSESKDSNFWSFIFTAVFIGAVAYGVYALYVLGVDFSVTVFEFVILALAIFRLIRLSTYDSIAQFARDIFTDREWSDAGDGTFLVTRIKPKKGPRRKLYELFACPWCIGVWVSAIVMFFFYYAAITWPVIVLLALAGLASVMQLSANLVGWHAEGKKISVDEHENSRDH